MYVLEMEMSYKLIFTKEEKGERKQECQSQQE
jgi:hypothetical protein